MGYEETANHSGPMHGHPTGLFGGLRRAGGVFSYGDGAVVTITDSLVTTTADNAGGLQTTGGAAMNATNVTAATSGDFPAVYSTADIAVNDAVLTAKDSEALVIEGQNSIALENCVVSGNMGDTQGTSSDENVHNVMIYQSISGDAAVGISSFSMEGGMLTALNGINLTSPTSTVCRASPA